MRKLFLYNVLLLVLLFLAGGCSTNPSAEGWKMTDQILKQIVPPVFPEAVFNIQDFGAVNDGETLCTGAIQTAIDQCSAQGGGRVVVPEGIYLTGAIHLKDNVNLHISENANLLFSRNFDDYLPLVHARFEGNDLMNYSPFIYAKGVKNIAISGKGKLDGNADTLTWWKWTGSKRFGWNPDLPNQRFDRDSLVEMANNGVPIEERVFGKGHYIRPNFIQFIECENILIEDLTILRSPMWEINPVMCNNITVRGLKIMSHGPNNDGCDPESCKNVLIENCYFDTGDDCIAIKSGREEDGRKFNIPSENIIVRNCEMKDGHGGVVIGSEISGGCRNVFIENCTMNSPNLDRALRIKSNSRRGGLIENIYMRNVKIGEVRQAVFLVNFFYAEGDAGDHTPVVRNIYIDNVSSEKSKYAIWIKGYKRSPVSNIRVSDCNFSGVEQENILSNVDNVKLKNVYINGEKVTDDLISSITDE
jgi:polygalacturonase